MGWVMNDVAVKEKREIEELELGGALKGETTRIAKPWYEERIREVG